MRIREIHSVLARECGVDIFTEVNLGEQWRHAEHGHNLGFRVGEVGLGLCSLILDCNFIVEFSGKLFSRQCPQILLLAVNH